ncbi:MAG: acyl-CoA thioesterase [Myxococcales bacterium]|nr:acyl-CoA thioesterase [Myxococcales bacterium]
MPRDRSGPPEGARVSTVTHRVAFYETDAMAIVHHSNYIRFFELARIVWMDEQHRPYADYVADGLHFATTHVAVDYHQPARYDDLVEIDTWPLWVRGASLAMAYAIRLGDAVLVTGVTEHAMVDEASGRPRRIPKEWRERLAATIVSQ